MSAIALDNVTLMLGGRTVLADISLAIDEGEFVGVLGANGSGKTTLLRAILGLVKPAAGTLAVLGRPARRGNPAIGYLAQSRGTVPEARISGRDFMASAIDGHRWGPALPSRESSREIERVLDLVGARQLAERPLADMSGGQRQRLLLAQALIGSPRLLLLDEPLISLDPHQQHVVVDLVRRLARDLKLIVLFSAHELNQLLAAVDRVLYLGHGQAALGTVDEVATPGVMSRLYGAPIDVLRVAGRIFVMSGDSDMEHEPHRHDHGDDHADHAHL